MITGIKNFSSAIWFYIVPLTSIILSVIVFYIPRTSDFWNLLRQAPFYAGLYFWSVSRPDTFNLLSAFILGTIADVIGSTPLGVNIITFLTLYLLTIKLASYFNIKKFSYSWLLFSLITLVTLAFKAILVSTFYRTLIPLNDLIIEFFLTATLYPLLVHFYTWVERRFIHLEEPYEKI